MTFRTKQISYCYQFLFFTTFMAYRTFYAVFFDIAFFINTIYISITITIITVFIRINPLIFTGRQ